MGFKLVASITLPIQAIHEFSELVLRDFEGQSDSEIQLALLEFKGLFRRYPWIHFSAVFKLFLEPKSMDKLGLTPRFFSIFSTFYDGVIRTPSSQDATPDFYPGICHIHREQASPKIGEWYRKSFFQYLRDHSHPPESPEETYLVRALNREMCDYMRLSHQFAERLSDAVDSSGIPLIHYARHLPKAYRPLLQFESQISRLFNPHPIFKTPLIFEVIAEQNWAFVLAITRSYPQCIFSHNESGNFIQNVIVNAPHEVANSFIDILISAHVADSANPERSDPMLSAIISAVFKREQPDLISRLLTRLKHFGLLSARFRISIAQLLEHAILQKLHDGRSDQNQEKFIAFNMTELIRTGLMTIRTAHELLWIMSDIFFRSNPDMAAYLRRFQSSERQLMLPADETQSGLETDPIQALVNYRIQFDHHIALYVQQLSASERPTYFQYVMYVRRLWSYLTASGLAFFKPTDSDEYAAFISVDIQRFQFQNGGTPHVLTRHLVNGLYIDTKYQNGGLAARLTAKSIATAWDDFPHLKPLKSIATTNNPILLSNRTAAIRPTYGDRTRLFLNWSRRFLAAFSKRDHRIVVKGAAPDLGSDIVAFLIQSRILIRVPKVGKISRKLSESQKKSLIDAYFFPTVSPDIEISELQLNPYVFLSIPLSGWQSGTLTLSDWLQDLEKWVNPDTLPSEISTDVYRWVETHLTTVLNQIKHELSPEAPDDLNPFGLSRSKLKIDAIFRGMIASGSIMPSYQGPPTSNPILPSDSEQRAYQETHYNPYVGMVHGKFFRTSVPIFYGSPMLFYTCFQARMRGDQLIEEIKIPAIGLMLGKLDPAHTPFELFLVN